MLRLIILIRTGWLCLTLSVTLLSKCYLYNSSNTCRVPVNQILKIFKYRALSDALAMSSVMSYCNQTHCLNSFQTLEETLRLCVPFFFFFFGLAPDMPSCVIYLYHSNKRAPAFHGPKILERRRL